MPKGSNSGFAVNKVNGKRGRTAHEPPDAAGFWVFAYGSLMWRPGFEYLERHPARVIGAHRAMCLLSYIQRGTPQAPGLVLGLDLGGQCVGIAYHVAVAAWPATLAYLREREQGSHAYREVHRRVRLIGQPEREVTALAYVIDRSHPQYAGNLTREEQLALVRQGHGRGGANRDYVLATVAELAQLGIRDDTLLWLAERL